MESSTNCEGTHSTNSFQVVVISLLRPNYIHRQWRIQMRSSGLDEGQLEGTVNTSADLNSGSGLATAHQHSLVENRLPNVPPPNIRGQISHSNRTGRLHFVPNTKQNHFYLILQSVRYISDPQTHFHCWRCMYRASYCMCGWPTICTILIFFLFHGFFSTCFERITRSSSGALYNVPIEPNCVIQYIIQRFLWWTSNYFETRRKNRGIKNFYKNSASSWSSTYFIFKCLIRISVVWVLQQVLMASHN